MARSHPWKQRARGALFLPEKANHFWGASRYIVPCGPFLSQWLIEQLTPSSY